MTLCYTIVAQCVSGHTQSVQLQGYTEEQVTELREVMKKLGMISICNVCREPLGNAIVVSDD